MKKFGILIYLVLLLLVGVFSFLNLFANNLRFGYEPANEVSVDHSHLTSAPLESQQLNRLEIVGPYKINHLQVFLLKGEDPLKGKKYMTLGDAMAKKLVRVNETGSVNQLSIDNLSGEYVFIHSGDIVKGGKQDRTIAYDVIIPPHTKNIPLESFCVESGRWTNRGNENVYEFSSNSKMLSSKELKMAAKYEKNQSRVWENVANQQQKLKSNLSDMNGYETEVASDESSTSLQLTLESKELEKVSDEIEKELKNLLSNHPTAVGYAYAINGEIYGVDIYSNQSLFQDLWPKIAESIATETISEEANIVTTAITASEVQQFISLENQSTEDESRQINSITEMEVKEDKDGKVKFNTIDKSNKNWVHKNYMRKTSRVVKQR